MTCLATANVKNANAKIFVGPYVKNFTFSILGLLKQHFSATVLAQVKGRLGQIS